MPPPSPNPSPDAAAFAARLEAIRARRLRAETDPTPWERDRYRRDPAGLRQAIRLRNDSSLKGYLGLMQAEMQKQSRALLAAGPAVFAAFSREISHMVRPVSYTRGTLTLAVPDDAVRFRVDRELRAGGETSIITALPVPVQRIKLTVRAAVELPEIDRRRPAASEAELERWEEIDAAGGAPAPSGGTLRCPACDAEFLPTPDARPAPVRAASSAAAARFARLSCPNCDARSIYRIS